MVVFLEEYKSSLASSSNRRFFLESDFAYSVYDFLADSKDTGKYEKIIKNYSESEKSALEEIADELWLIDKKERKMTRLFLLEILKGKHKKIMEDLDRYLIVFYKGYEGTDHKALNIEKE